MSKEKADESIVVWHPSSSVPDAREWASLCLFNDRIVIFYACGIQAGKAFYENVISKTDGVHKTASGATKQINEDNRNAIVCHNFLRTLEVLERENVVRIITHEEVHKMPSQFLTWSSEVFNSVMLQAGHGPAAVETLISLGLSRYYSCPFISDYISLREDMAKAEILLQVLAKCTICQLALPDVRAFHVEDILEARTELKDQLVEFRNGMRDLTWYLYLPAKNRNEIDEIRQDANVLVNTKIAAALMALERRIRQHKKKRIRRMLFSTSRVLIDAGMFSCVSLGKTLLRIAGEIDNVKPPEDQVATYLYRLKERLTPR